MLIKGIIVFVTYTYDCRADFPNIPIIKYADDTIIQALIKKKKYLKKKKGSKLQ